MKLTVKEMEARHLHWKQKMMLGNETSSNKVLYYQYWLTYRQEAYWSARIALRNSRGTQDWSFWMKSCKHWKKGARLAEAELKKALTGEAA